MDNPFIIRAYKSKELFCDREEELRLLMGNCTCRRDTTLISQRRIGKTGLILRLYDELKEARPDIHTIYVDIFASQNIDDFIRMLAEAAMRAFPQKTTIGEKLLVFIKALRPQVSFDTITGEPQLQISYQTAQEKEYTLRSLFDFLDSQQTPIVMAIDEFQQIREYPETNLEALLRTYIQQTHNITFIFCGSKKHIMTDIFTNARKPFYASTAFLNLGKIPTDIYKAFITSLFAKGQRQIEDEALDFVLDWTRCHTFYTQQLCHTIYENGSALVNIVEAKAACVKLLQQGEAFYLQYRQMLTEKQWKFLVAVAKEGAVRQVTSSVFLQRHNLGTPSSARQQAEALCEKGLLDTEATLDYVEYSVSDVFFSRWLEKL